MVICIPSFISSTGRLPADTTAPTITPDPCNKGPRLDITHIQTAVYHYYQNGLATATQRCYYAGQQRCQHFCTQANLTPVPTSENTLLMFAAHLAMSGLAHTSIKVYFSSIGNLHSSCSQHDAYHKALTPCLEQVLRGIKREQASTHTERVHLPITAEIIQQVYSVLSRPPSEYWCTMLWAAYIFWFSSSLRDDRPKPGCL